MPLPARGAGALATACLLATTACGGHGPVSVTLPSATAHADSCAGLAAALPASLEGRSRRKTSPTSVRVTAWGAPAVVLRCGVGGRPDDTGEQVTVDGVAWRTAGPSEGTVLWTTTDRATVLELTVPASIDNQENLLADLAPAVSSSLSRVPAPASAAPSSAAASS